MNTKQNLVQQALDVLSLEIDTAGTIGKELKIHALEQSFALELQKQLSSAKQSPDAKETSVQKEIEEKLILKLSPADLLKIGISENHFRAGSDYYGFWLQVYQKIQDLFQDRANEYSNEFVQYMSDSNWVLLVFLLVFF